MKKINLLFLILVLSAQLFGQQPGSSDSLYRDFMKKSRNQKNIGIVLAVTGSGAAIIGGLIWLTDFSQPSPGGKEMNAGRVLMILGSVTAVASIPFFIASSENKRKASLSLQLRASPHLQNNGLTQSPVPSLSLKINL